jgi:hypothetical protein
MSHFIYISSYYYNECYCQGLLGRDTVWFGTWVMFQRNLMPQYSGQKSSLALNMKTVDSTETSVPSYRSRRHRHIPVNYLSDESTLILIFTVSNELGRTGIWTLLRTSRATVAILAALICHHIVKWTHNKRFQLNGTLASSRQGF